MLKLFVGQYKNESTLIKFNMVRYTTICIVLDYFCYMNSVSEDVVKTLDFLVDAVFKKSSIKDTEENRTMIQTTILNMKMIGLLFEPETDYLAITDQGKMAYISQSYHLAAANLYQANASRRLSKIAIWVAVAGIVLTFLLQVFESTPKIPILGNVTIFDFTLPSIVHFLEQLF